MNVSAFLLASKDHVALQPGFRLHSLPTGATLWWPSESRGQASDSATSAFALAEQIAVPWLKHRATLRDFAASLKRENWGSRHHLAFEQGIAAALLGRDVDACSQLHLAVRLYRDDGREWCRRYESKCEMLLSAIAEQKGKALLADWAASNRRSLRLP